MAKHCLNCEKRIGVLGGTFDPVHNGHVALGKAALQEGNLSRLIIILQKCSLSKETERLPMTCTG